MDVLAGGRRGREGQEIGAVKGQGEKLEMRGGVEMCDGLRLGGQYSEYAHSAVDGGAEEPTLRWVVCR